LLTLIIILVAVALVFDFLNGFHDSSNIVATVISSRALSPRTALALCAVAEFAGPFIFGVAVAKTIGEEVVPAHTITLAVIYAALLAAITWNLITWYLGIPSSSSHALIGGIIGAVAIHAGFHDINFGGVEKIFIALFLSPLIGLGVGYVLTKVIFFHQPRLQKFANLHFHRAGAEPRRERCAKDDGHHHAGAGHGELSDGVRGADLGHFA